MQKEPYVAIEAAVFPMVYVLYMLCAHMHDSRIAVLFFLTLSHPDTLATWPRSGAIRGRRDRKGSSWWQSQQCQPDTTSGWSLPPPPARPAPSSASWPPLPPPATTWSNSSPNDATPTAPNPARVPLQKNFKEDTEHYDSTLVFKSTLKKVVEPTAWSRAKGVAGMDIRDVTVVHLSRRGLDEFWTPGTITRSLHRTYSHSQRGGDRAPIANSKEAPRGQHRRRLHHRCPP